MNDFRLGSKFINEIEGYQIQPHFANVLNILCSFESAEDDVSKAIAIKDNFFNKDCEISLSKAIEIFFMFFFSSNDTSEKQIKTAPSAKTEKTFCYKFDASEIYADFLREYSIDLAESENLHWHKFIALLQGLTDESALKRKIALRFKDLTDYKGEVLAELSRAKEAVQLPIKVNEIVSEQIEKFKSYFND